MLFDLVLFSHFFFFLQTGCLATTMEWLPPSPVLRIDFDLFHPPRLKFVGKHKSRNTILTLLGIELQAHKIK